MNEAAEKPNIPPLTDRAFLAQIQSAEWPLAEWHHRQHIKLAWICLRRYPLETAALQIRAWIKAYNAAKQIPESPTGGYHETMTQAWLRLVHFTMCEYGPEDSSDAFYEMHPQLWGKKTLRFFYTRETFLSPPAKTEFLPPDIIPLPQSKNPAPPVIDSHSL